MMLNPLGLGSGENSKITDTLKFWRFRTLESGEDSWPADWHSLPGVVECYKLQNNKLANERLGHSAYHPDLGGWHAEVSLRFWRPCRTSHPQTYKNLEHLMKTMVFTRRSMLDLLFPRSRCVQLHKPLDLLLCIMVRQFRGL